MKKHFANYGLCIISLLLTGQIFAQDNNKATDTLAVSQPFEYKYRLTLKDKGTEKKRFKPTDLISQKALERRKKQNIGIDEKDYPISPKYLEKIKKLGGRIVSASKWNNTVVIQPKDSTQLQKIEKLPFVKKTTLVWRGHRDTKEYPASVPNFPIPAEKEKKSDDKQKENVKPSYYGAGYDNIRLENGQFLHDKGYKGEGIVIAVIDGGFKNFPGIEYLDNVKILGTKSFVDDSPGLFTQDNEHGTNVLSCIGTNKPYKFVGTAPEASFYLLGSEDDRTEFPIEEDYWAAAIEYADSIGVDLVNSSLGYTGYDAPIGDLTHDILDGKSSLISNSAEIAADKGMILVLSAGNAGNKPWKKISPPGDAAGVLTIGAMQKDSIIAPFSSVGLTKDLRMKPDVVALGVKAATVNKNGEIAPKNGTSFASPIMCGLVACLWQAYPDLSNQEIMDIVRLSGDRKDEPTVKYGFGIPDMKKAYELGAEISKNKKQK